jgi:Zn-finger nucleic acid-binding protein
VSRVDFLQLDQCPEHGVWLDPGELVKALESAQAGLELKALLAKLQPKPRGER